MGEAEGQDPKPTTEIIRVKSGVLFRMSPPNFEATRRSFINERQVKSIILKTDSPEIDGNIHINVMDLNAEFPINGSNPKTLTGPIVCQYMGEDAPVDIVIDEENLPEESWFQKGEEEGRRWLPETLPVYFKPILRVDTKRLDKGPISLEVEYHGKKVVGIIDGYDESEFTIPRGQGKELPEQVMVSVDDWTDAETGKAYPFLFFPQDPKVFEELELRLNY